MGVSRPTYASREDVKSVANITTTRDDRLVDDAIEAASTNAEGLLHRRFYPWTGTRKLDWPNHQHARSWRLWLDENEMISISALKVDNGDTTLSASTYFLRRADSIDEPPYDSIEIDLGTSGAFSSSTSHQRAIWPTGVFGGHDATVLVGTVAEALDDNETGIDVSDSTQLGVGDLVKVDSELMLVTARAMLTTGQTVQTTALTASKANVTVLVTSGAALNVGETILIDSERMRVSDIAGNTVTVERAVDGTVLAAHNTGVTIYAPRTLTVTRGAVGTTAATHLTAAPLSKQAYPGLVKALTVAYALNQLQQQGAAYARVSGTGENAKEFTGRGIKALEDDARQAHGRTRFGGV
jgi:hypothetical protein